MSDQYVADDERDAILDRLLTLPDNKVSLILPFLTQSFPYRFVLTVKARIPSGHPQTLESFFVTNVLLFIEI